MVFTVKWIDDIKLKLLRLVSGEEFSSTISVDVRDFNGTPEEYEELKEKLREEHRMKTFRRRASLLSKKK